MNSTQVNPTTDAELIDAPVPPAKAEPTKKASGEYVNNKGLLEEFHRSKEAGQMTPEFAKMLTLICKRYASKANFVSYTYNEDMQSFAMLNLVKSWKSFNAERSNNPFSYYTSCITNSFLQYLNQERRHRNIRDMLLVENGLDPSYTFAENQAVFINPYDDPAAMGSPASSNDDPQPNQAKE